MTTHKGSEAATQLTRNVSFEVAHFHSREATSALSLGRQSEE